MVHATHKPCPFFPYRMGDRRISVKILRAFCMECQGGSSSAVADCANEDCLLFPYRFGTNPARAGMDGHIRENIANFRQKTHLTVPEQGKTEVAPKVNDTLLAG